MNKLIKQSIDNSKIVFVIVGFILLAGIMSYVQMPKQENPQIGSPAAIIQTVFPGAPASSVDAMVTRVIEEKAAEVPGIDWLEAESFDNYSLVTIMLKTGQDTDVSWDELDRVMKNVSSVLPDDCDTPIVNTDITSVAGVILSFGSHEESDRTLTYYAERYKQKFKQVSGVRKVDVLGGLQDEIVVELDYKELNRYDLSTVDVSQLVASQNLSIPAGAITLNGDQFNLNQLAGYKSIDSVKNLIIGGSSDTGAIIRLKDIADIRFDKTREKVFKQMDEDVVLLAVYFEDDINVVSVGREIREIMSEQASTLVDGVEVNEVVFLPEDISASVNAFIINLIEGVVIVLVIICLAMGLRTASITAFSIPLSFAMAFIVMRFMNIDIQQISIAALIVSLGIMVDNSVVVSDAIHHHLNRGVDKAKSAYLGAQESSIPVLTSTLTTIAAFAPLATLPGEEGKFIYSLPMVVIVSLTASYIAAMFVTPSLSVHFFRIEKNKEQKSRWVRIFFERLLTKGLSYKKKTLMLAFAGFGLAMLLVATMNISIFPFSDKNIMYINIEAEEKGNLGATEAIVSDITKILRQDPYILSYTSSAGDSVPRFDLTLQPVMPADDKAQIIMRYDIKEVLKKYTRGDYMYKLQRDIESQVMGASIEVKCLALTSPEPDIEVKILSEDGERIRDVALRIEKGMHQIDGLYNVKNNTPFESYEYVLNIDEDLASVRGLSKYDIQTQVSVAVRGQVVTTIYEGSSEIPIRIEGNMDTIESIENLKIKSSVTGEKILLKDVASLDIAKRQVAYRNIDEQRASVVSAYVRPGNAAALLQLAVEDAVDTLDTRGVDIIYGGQDALMTSVFGGFAMALAVALVIVYIILLIQFNSFKQPLIILTSVLLSTIGAIIALKVFNQDLSFTVFLGIISLMGIVVNNAILLIEYIERARKHGHAIDEACVDAVDKRFRPIILTSATTIMGLIPLILSRSSFFTPMAISLMGGLIFSTLLTLIVVPVAYSFFNEDVSVEPV